MRYRFVLVLCLVAVSLRPGFAEAQTTRPVLDAADYGERLPASERVELWWCPAAWKVGRTRPAPRAPGTAVRMSAAGNEFEAVQVVLRPKDALSGLRCSVNDLVGPAGGLIPRREIQVLRVRYVPVTTPTDKLGQVGDWPDPLPPFTEPMDLAAGVNQPIWILVHVPPRTAPGDYSGQVTFTARDWAATVPLKLRVWDFTLPDVPRTQSAFGLSTGTIFKYHNVQTPEDRRAVFAMYMQSFADHRISPYNPTPFDPIEFKFLPEAEPPRAEVRFDRFDQAMQEAIERYHITSFMLGVPGMGGGTFHSRHEGTIQGHKAGSPAYEAMFASAVGQVESHLREKGWLDKAYVYWFDEPEPRDYDFVRAGMARLNKYAPGICRMLTEEPSEPLFGAVDLWCPVSPEFNMEMAEKRRAAGERFWWYVCTGPKQPYCTLFIDHPATSLRAWLWQTWQRKIQGILVWESVYWTSSAAFPESVQNPYEDPMGYVSGYSTPAGTKKHWGNGDGRFLYPPEAAAAGSATPVLEPPVSSIRWEMLRDGLEDLDYLYILADRIEARQGRLEPDLRKEAEGLLAVPTAITASMTEYTFDPTPIHERRQAVAEMIEKLTVAR